MRNNKTTLEFVELVAKLSDGTVRRVMMNADEQQCILTVITGLHGGVLKIGADVLPFDIINKADKP